MVSPALKKVRRRDPVGSVWANTSRSIGRDAWVLTRSPIPALDEDWLAAHPADRVYVVACPMVGPQVMTGGRAGTSAGGAAPRRPARVAAA